MASTIKFQASGSHQLVSGVPKRTRVGAIQRCHANRSQQFSSAKCEPSCWSQIGVTATGTFLSFAMLCLPASAEGTVEESFSFTCAGCHAGGGNVVGGPGLELGDLEKNGMLNTEALENIIYSGKGKMPGYGMECAPKGQCTFARRFSDAEVADMAKYVLEKANEGWN